MLYLKTLPLFAERKVGLTKIVALTASVILAGLAGCASSDPDDSSHNIGSDESAGGALSTEEFAVLEFDAIRPVTLKPGELSTLSLLVTPARNQMVIFEILTNASDFDGFLLEGTSRVNEEGRTTTVLQAPNHPSTFVLRASISENEEVRMPISVSEKGYATLKVAANYPGIREIEQWTASVSTDKSCAELGSYYEDGPLMAKGAGSITLGSVPSGTPLAVTVHGGELAAGCMTVPGVNADEEREILVEINDRPVGISSGALQLSFGVESTTTAFAQHLESAIQAGIASFRGEETRDGPALLVRMGEMLTENEREIWTKLVASLDLDSALTGVWNSDKVISARIDSLLITASAQALSDDTFVGTLELEGEYSTFFLSEAAGIPSALSGFFEGSAWALSVGSGDTLVLGGSLTYEPLRWIAAIADTNESLSPAAALREAARCDLVSELVNELNEGPPFPNCAQDCIETLCSDALEQAWKELKTGGNGVLSNLQIGASGAVTLEGQARIASFDGTWVGRLGDEETSIKGPIWGENLDD